MNCQICGNEMKIRAGLRGVSPILYAENGHCCTNFGCCVLSGVLIYRDYTPEKIRNLAALSSKSTLRNVYAFRNGGIR
jgi:hypothetical protein